MGRRSPSYSITARLRYSDRPGQLGRLTSMIGRAEGLIGAVDIVEVKRGEIVRDISIGVRDEDHGQQILEMLRGLNDVKVIRVSDRTFLLHLGGKIEINSKIPLNTRDDLSMIYTPGVARVCRAIHADPEASFVLTIRRNTVAVISDGSAVLGLGNLGPLAAMPVMEGKAVLFKQFAGVNAFPICLDTQDPRAIIETCVHLAPTFGGINLEDISAPRCVEIEEELAARLEIPVFHDDQHGTAVVVLAALQNALKLVDKRLAEAHVVICGAGAAGIATAKLLMSAGVGTLTVCDREGILCRGGPPYDSPVKQWLAEHTNPRRLQGPTPAALAGADAFIGVSGPGVLQPADLKCMARDPLVFALANPDPEVNPELAAEYAAVMATGRSDFPNQINNVLCFPGFFRGLLDVRARRVTDRMKLEAAAAIAHLISDDELTADYIVPSVFDRRVAPAVARAVSRAAIDDGVARRHPKKLATRHHSA